MVKKKLDHPDYVTYPITILDVVESIRKRPGMYIGNLDQAVNTMLYELLANAIDLFLNKSLKQISLSIEGNRITYTDDGPGLPFDQSINGVNKVEFYMTELHNTATADDHTPHVHVHPSTIGLVAVNSLSSEVVMRSVTKNGGYEQHFSKGKVKTELSRVNDGTKTKTYISFVPDIEIVGENSLDMEALRMCIMHTSYLYPGLTITLNGDKYYSKNGLIDYAHAIEDECAVCSSKDLSYSFVIERDEMIVDVALLGEGDEELFCRSYVNGCRTRDHGSHVTGLKRALGSLKISPAIALIHVIMKDPIYNSPTKDRISNKEAEKTVRTVVFEYLKKLQ